MKGNFETLEGAELEKKRAELKAELRKLRFELAIAGSTPNPKRIREAKKEVARINTVLRAREIEAAKSGNDKAEEKSA